MTRQWLPSFLIGLAVACAPSLDGAVCGSDDHCLPHERCDGQVCTVGSRDAGPAGRDGGNPGADAGTKPSTDAGEQPPGPGDGGTVETDGGEVDPDGGSLDPDGGTFQTDGGTVGEDDGASGQDGGIAVQDGGSFTQDGGTSAHDAGMSPLDGGTPAPDEGCSSGTTGCGALLANGAACTSGSACTSGNCVDGVCCNVSCGGTCMTCAAQGSIGTCAFAPVGTDPENECGTAQCGSGACVTSCTVNAQCKTGAACTLGACVPVGPTKANGAACAAASECASGFCTDGVCCNTACGGTCLTCVPPGNQGTCLPSSSGTDPDGECGWTFCEDKACRQSCNSSAQCKPGAFCKSGTWTCAELPPLKADGVACLAGTECLSGACSDGVCCDVACAGPCMTCGADPQLGLSAGRCHAIAAGTDPDSECDLTYCASGACMTSCGGSNPSCKALAFCNAQKVCEAVRAIGASCSAGNECASGFCTDGFCCDQACNGGICDTCSAALGASANGVCTFLPPTTLCRGATGPCDVEERCTGGSGQCPADSHTSPGTPCGDPVVVQSACSYSDTCAESGVRTVSTTPQVCDGASHCVAGQPVSTPATCSRSTDQQKCGDTVVTYGTCSPVDCGEPTCGCEHDVTTESYSCAGGTCVLKTEYSSEGCFGC